MLSTDCICKTHSSLSSFSESINERASLQGISMVETTLRVTDLRFLETCISSTSFEGREFRMIKTKSHTSVLQLGDISDDVVGSLDQDTASPRPTPLDFPNFLPWLCSEWQSPQFVHVTREFQDDYVSVIQEPHATKSKAGGSSKHKGKRKEAVPKTIVEDGDSPIVSKQLSQISFADKPLFITAVFNTKSYLVEVAITDQNLDIHRKTLQAIRICIPFHCFLTRLTLRWAKLNYMHIYEINKFLPDSNLTDIVLDDTVGSPNYEDLLSQKSPLLYLSLNRCKIDDEQCKKIAANIDFGTGGATLNILELGSNFITDVGAQALAESLRRNRHLMHLNLSGNMITDDGAVSLLSHLMKFQLRRDEILEAKRRKLLFVQTKMKMYKQESREVMIRGQSGDTLKKKSKPKPDFKNPIKKVRRKASTSLDDLKDNDFDDVTESARQRAGEFVDPYDTYSTITENAWTYCTGNVALCSLNLAYNSLSYHSIQKIHEVLKYQNEMMDSEGLKRVNFSGNQLPVDCELYTEITNYLLNTLTVAKKHLTKLKQHKSLKSIKTLKSKGHD